MRLTIPEPKIELYKDGFDKHDKLSRKETGDKLSNLVERIDDPLVIALDGAWGSGKSVFLKCWVGEHLKREGNTTQTVYFDAFKYDYLDDPLIALTGAIAERFHGPEDNLNEEQKKSAKERKAKFRKAAWAVSKSAGRIGLSAITFGATEILSDLGDEVVKAVGDEAKAFLNSSSGDVEADKFWDMHKARIAAMDAFRLSLTELTEPASDGDNVGKPTKKLVVVIDELDRCRPDYALSILEIVKHFFNVDGVHFVLGTNLDELKNIVLARHGAGSDANKYLHKFISIHMDITQKNFTRRIGDTRRYYSEITERLGTSDDWQHIRLKNLMDMIPNSNQPTLREIERIAINAAICPKLNAKSEFDLMALAMLTLLQVAKPDLFREMLCSQANLEEVLDYFGLTEHDRTKLLSDDRGCAYWVCKLTQTPNVRLTSTKEANYFESVGLGDGSSVVRRHILTEIYQNTLGLFRFTG